MTKKKSSKTTSKKASKQHDKSVGNGSKQDGSVVKVNKMNYYVWPAVAVFMTIVFLAVVLNKPNCDSDNSSATMKAVQSDELIFINADGCQEACEQMEPVAKNVAQEANLEFRKITTPEKIQVPGYMVIADKETKSLLRPIQDKASFYNEICSATDDNQVCSEAEKLAKETQQQKQQQQEQSLENIPETDKPTVDLYIMSFCPYGNKAENTLEPVYESLKGKADFNVNYIVSEKGGEIQSLHGQKEVEQNKREVCVMEEYGMDEFFDFVTHVNDNCGSKGGCWEEAANEAGVDTETIQTCVEERGTELMKEEAKKAQEAGASGSPTMMINGQETKLVYNYGQPASYQKAICAGFSEQPSECSENIESVESAQGAAGSC